MGIRMQNHRCNEVENAFLIFKVKSFFKKTLKIQILDSQPQQLFVDNISSTELLATSSGAAEFSPAGRQPYDIEERLPNERRGQLTVRAPTTTVRASTTIVSARSTTPVHGTTLTGAVHETPVQNDVAVRNDEADALPVSDTVVEPSNQPAGSTRRQSNPLTPTRNGFASLRSPYAAAGAPLRVTAFFFMFFPFCYNSFWLLCPSAPPFHRTPRPNSTIDRVAVIFFFSRADIIDCIALLYVICHFSSYSTLFHFTHRVVNFKF